MQVCRAGRKLDAGWSNHDGRCDTDRIEEAHIAGRLTKGGVHAVPGIGLMG